RVLDDARIARPALQELEGVAHRGEGIPQLVGQHGEELVLAAIGGGELLRALAELVLETLPLGDVHAHAEHARRAPARTREHPALPRHPAEAPVGRTAAELDVEAAPLLDGASDRRVDGGPILGMDELAEGVERAREAARSEAVDALQVLGPPQAP